MTTKTRPRRFTPLEILDRAAEYEIRIALDGQNLMIDVPTTLDDDKKDKALAVISTNQSEIIDYLQKLITIPLCYTCLDQDKEVPALPDDYEGIMYCLDHHPAKRGDINGEV